MEVHIADESCLQSIKGFLFFAREGIWPGYSISDLAGTGLLPCRMRYMGSIDQFRWRQQIDLQER